MNNANAMKYGFIKVAAATPVINVADCYENAENIISDIHEAEKNKVKLVVFPELCITGYTIGDLVYSPHLLDNALIALNKIADATKGLDILVFVGLPYVCNSLIYNVAAAVYNGKVLGFVPITSFTKKGILLKRRMKIFMLNSTDMKFRSAKKLFLTAEYIKTLPFVPKSARIYG